MVLQLTVDYWQSFALEGVLFFSPFVRNRVVLFCGLVAERQYNPPSSSYRVLVQWCCVGPCLFGPGRVGLGTMLLNWVFFFPQWGLGVCVVLWSVGCKSIQFLVHSTGGWQLPWSAVGLDLEA